MATKPQRAFAAAAENASNEGTVGEVFGHCRMGMTPYWNMAINGMGAIVSPYESLYVKRDQNDVVGSLNRFFNECGVEKVADVHDAADQLGVELAFVAELLAREISQAQAGDIAAAMRRRRRSSASWARTCLAGRDFGLMRPQRPHARAITAAWRALFTR